MKELSQAQPVPCTDPLCPCGGACFHEPVAMRLRKQAMKIPAGYSIEKPGGATSEFLIEYDDAEPGVVRIDGVRVSVELLTTMIVDPQRDKFFKFERNGDLVMVKQVTSVEIME